MNKLLVVVDYQNDFVSGSLGFPGAEALEGAILEKISAFKANGYEVVYTLDTHDENYLNTREGKELPVEHCISGTNGWKLYGGVDEALKGCRGFVKHTFGSAELFHYLLSGGYESIEFCGLVSNICVLSNAILARAACPEAKVIVDARLTLAPDPSMQEKTLDVLAGAQITVLGRR